MTKHLKEHLGYGFIPALILFLLFYTHYFSVHFSHNFVFLTPIMSDCIFYSIVAFIFLKTFHYEIVIDYLGFQFLSLEKRFMYLGVYYFLFLIGFDKILPDFIDTINSVVLFTIPIFFLLLLEYLLTKYQIFVLFSKVIPNLYVDLIMFDTHNKFNILDYDIVPNCEEELSINKLLFYYEFFCLKKLKKDKLKSDVDVNINIDDKRVFVKTQSWEGDFSLDIKVENEEKLKEEINYAVTYFENLKKERI